MTSGLASVVICAHNNWPDVEMTIESALNQSYQSVEVIVVDNSSTDATQVEVVKRFGNVLRYIRQQNRHYAGACNTGFGLARGEFIQFVAGDDVLAPNKIEKQVKVFLADPSLDIVFGDVRMFQTAGGFANWTDVTPKPEPDYLKAFIQTHEQWTGITALGILFRRRILEKVGAWDEDLYVEDLDYWLRAACAGCRFGYSPGSPMGFVRVWPGQKSRNASAMMSSMEAVWQKALGYVAVEPYHSLIAAKLAKLRFYLAVRKDNLDRRQALAKLTLARAMSPETISVLTYVAGCIAVVLPGGTALVRSPWLAWPRRIVARMVRFRLLGEPAEKT